MVVNTRFSRKKRDKLVPLNDLHAFQDGGSFKERGITINTQAQDTTVPIEFQPIPAIGRPPIADMGELDLMSDRDFAALFQQAPYDPSAYQNFVAENKVPFSDKETLNSKRKLVRRCGGKFKRMMK